MTACPHCACISPDGAQAHAVLVSLGMDDIDEALSQGLLDGVTCPACNTSCAALLVTAREARQFALEARERHRSRGVRLQRRKAEREAERVPKISPTQSPALPAAAADVLARALAKARKPR